MSKLNKDKFLGTLRDLFVAIGAVLFTFFPHIEGVYMEVSGIVLALAGLGWAIAAKDLSKELLLSTVKKVAAFVGIFFAGKIDADLLATITSIAVTLATVGYGIWEKHKRG